jgi:SAM-dependent methyltransferase
LATHLDNVGGTAESSSASDRDVYQLLDLAEAMVPSRALQVAADIGIADLFSGAARPVAELAAETSTNPRVLRSMLRLLAGQGVFVETAEGEFALTPRGELLRSDHPRSLRAFIRDYGYDFHSVLFLDHSLRTGEPAFPHIHGESYFDFHRTHPDRGAVFDAAMADLSRVESAAITSAYDFSGYRRIVDVGGGDGTLLSAVLATYPAATGVVFDQPHVTGRAEQLREKTGLGDRLAVIAGDFFDEVVPGGDLYLMKSIIHDWPDEQAVQILRSCRRAMPPHGRLVLFEHMLVSDNDPSQTKTWDLLLFLLLGGHERTREDFGKLFAASGFRLDRTVKTGSVLYAVEAVPAPVR